MKVIFTSKTKEDFRKHNDYVRKQKKSDGHKYQSYELKGINKSFKNNLRENLEKIKEPKDSIFPKEFEYSSNSHKMYVDKKSHYVVFYKVIRFVNFWTSLFNINYQISTTYKINKHNRQK